MATLVILCGPADEDNFSFEDLVDAECKVVQELAGSYEIEGPATIKDLQEYYEIIYVSPVRTCLKAAALWALDTDVEVRIVRSINFGMEVPFLSDEKCRSLCEECGLLVLSHNDESFSSKRKLMFMPNEAEKVVGENCKSFHLSHTLQDIITAVQRSTEEAVLEEARLGSSK